MADSHRPRASGHAPSAHAVYREIARWDWRIWGQIAGKARLLGADWVHVQYQTGAYAMHPAINFAPWFWRRRCGLHVAWTYHDLRVPYLFPKAGSRIRRWVTEHPATTSDLVFVTNEGDRLVLEKRTSRLVKIPIGSNIEGRVFSPAERQARRSARGFTEDDLVVGYFGFLNRSKGGLMLVRTLKRLVHAGRSARLLMIGERIGSHDPTNVDTMREVEALIRHFDLEAYIQWTGQESSAEVSADLALCDVLLLPYTDGASLRRGTLMAGLAHGCAIVTTQPEAPLPELVGGRDVLYVAPEDDAAAAQAVLQLADNPALAAGLRARAYAASMKFTWATIAQQHLACYQAGESC
jgi:glycosyltransferase involved in cell wall biosynthesis